MRPKLVSLTMSGFRSFLEESTVEFPATGLTLLQGCNNDTNGSSGSGKSTVALAIAFALGFSPYPATALTTRGSKTALKVELKFAADIGEVIIRRSTTPPSLWVNGQPIKGGAKAVEATLLYIFGADPDMLALLTYRGQRKPGLFLSRTDSEKKELLVRLIPRLIKFEEAVEVGQTHIKELEAKEVAEAAQLKFLQGTAEPLENLPSIELIESDLDEAKNEHRYQVLIRERAEATVARLASHRQSEADTAFNFFHEALERADSFRKALLRPVFASNEKETARLSELVAGAVHRIETLTKVDEAKQQQVRGARELLAQKILACRQVAGQNQPLLSEAQRLQEELTTLEEHQCPTCMRPWDQCGDKRDELEEALEEVERKLGLCRTAEETEEALQAQLRAVMDVESNPLVEKLQAVRSQAQEELRTEKQRRASEEAKVYAEYLQHRAELESSYSALKLAQQEARADVMARPLPELEKASKAVEAARLAAQEHAMTVAMLSQSLQEAHVTHDRYQRLMDQLAGLQSEHKRHQLALSEERDLLGALGREGFLGSIFDEVLEDIGAEANKILASVANTRHCTLTFRSESVTQKGTVKKSIVPIVTVDGEEAPLEAGTSGGMLSAIELAVDLALGKVVTEREGITPGWLILDESFGGLGPVEMESCLEILNQYAQERLVLVVEHASEMKSMFPHRINVEYSNGRSHFSQTAK